jgi:hypothetical protein
MTICIAAICEAKGRFSKIILCADRATSSVVEFEGAEPKFKKLTDHCYAMHSSNDSLVSDMILENVTEKVKGQNLTEVKAIANLLVQECLNRKKEQIEKDVLFNYNIVADSLKSSAQSVMEKAIDNVQNYTYDFVFDFIVAGLEPSGEAHLYWVNQDGTCKCYDSIGYCAIGSGYLPAFLQFNKVVYKADAIWQQAAVLTYFAKKTAEKAPGVGDTTDLLVLHFPQPDDPNCKPVLATALEPKTYELLDKGYLKMAENQIEILNETCASFVEFTKARAEELIKKDAEQKQATKDTEVT